MPLSQKDIEDIRSLPFVEKVSEWEVEYKPVKFGKAVIKGMVLDMFDLFGKPNGRLYQKTFVRPRHPHDRGDSMCADLYELRLWIQAGNMVGAVLEGFRIINSYNPINAMQTPPGSVPCYFCGAMDLDKNYGYFTDEGFLDSSDFYPDADNPAAFFDEDGWGISFCFDCKHKLDKHVGDLDEYYD